MSVGRRVAHQPPCPLQPAQLQVDGSRCDGHGICALRCPERITLDLWGYATADPAPIVGRRSLARARRAAAACPAGALALVSLDDDGRAGPQAVAPGAPGARG